MLSRFATAACLSTPSIKGAVSSKFRSVAGRVDAVVAGAGDGVSGALPMEGLEAGAGADGVCADVVAGVDGAFGAGAALGFQRTVLAKNV